jgi:hypothetical protein
MSQRYTITEEQKKQFAAAYLLDRMVNRGTNVPVYLEGHDKDLEPVLEYMMMKEYIDIPDKATYKTTDKGKEVLSRFTKRYQDFLINFDVYCAVDLEAGEFAFSRYFDFDSDTAFEGYLQNDRWDDLRIAVAVYKKINPVEIVFMSFLREGRFGDQGDGWQFDLLLGSIWDEILEIANTAVHADELGYEDDQGVVNGEEVLDDVIRQGAELNITLRKKEREMRQEQAAAYDDDDDEDYDDYDDVIYEETVYYADPFYVSPWWGVVVFF